MAHPKNMAAPADVVLALRDGWMAEELFRLVDRLIEDDDEFKELVDGVMDAHVEGVDQQYATELAEMVVKAINRKTVDLFGSRARYR